MTPYATLGIPLTASADEIDRAYKRCAREAHPDRNGGANEQFLAVQKAYDLLKDPELRRQYDETGEWGERKPDRSLEKPMQVVQQTFVAVLRKMTEQHQEPKHYNVVELMRQALDFTIERDEQTRGKIKRILESFRDCLDRFTTKEDDNLMAGLIAHQITSTERELQACEGQIELCKKAKEIIKRFKFKHRAKPSNGAYTGTSATATMVGWVTFG